MIYVCIVARRLNLPRGEVIYPREAAQDRRRVAVGPAHRLHHPWRHSRRRVHADGIGGGRLHLRLPRHDVHLPRLQVERTAPARRPRRAHRRHGDDHDRLLGRLRLHDGDHAGAEDWPPISSSSIANDKYTLLLLINVLLLVLGTFMDLAPMLLICTPIFLPIVDDVRRRSGAFRHHHDPQPRHRPADAAGRADAGGRLRYRQGVDGGSIASILIFYIPMLIVLALVTYVPAISLWLPSVLK